MRVALKTREEMAFEMGISPQTLRRWLKKEGIILKNRLISLDDQIKIYELLGFSFYAEIMIDTLSQVKAVL